MIPYYKISQLLVLVAPMAGLIKKKPGCCLFTNQTLPSNNYPLDRRTHTPCTVKADRLPLFRNGYRMMSSMIMNSNTSKANCH